MEPVLIGYFPKHTSRKADGSKVVLIILASLLPPLAVYLKTNSAKDTVINLLLCIVFWIPGILHALYLVSK